MEIEFLRQIAQISGEYEKNARLKGENFNIFEVLELGRRELCHSCFIAHLLSPYASHNKGDLFLRLFLKTVGIEDFSLEGIEVGREYSRLNGRIDIVVKNAEKKIFIENKIYGDDQPTQLKRYAEHNPIGLFYLTLDGHDASDDSKGDLKEGEDYFCISYKVEILDWLEECLKESASFLFLRESIRQYVLLIKTLTGQSRRKEMSNEIVDLISADKNALIGVFEIQEVLDELKEKTIEEKLKSIADGITCEFHSFLDRKDKKENKLAGFTTNFNYSKKSDIKKEKRQNKFFTFEFVDKNISFHIGFGFQKIGYTELKYGFWLVNDKSFKEFLHKESKIIKFLLNWLERTRG